MENEYADILSTVVENGRLTDWTADEVEVQVDFEARERGLSEAEIAGAVAWALAHTELRDG